MDRPLYILPFRVLVSGLLAVFLLGFVGGLLGSSFLVRRIVRVTPEGQQIVERVERVAVPAEQAIPERVEELSARVGLLLDEGGRPAGHVLPVTADGLAVGTGPAPAGALRVRFRGQDPANTSLVRAYPESGIFFVRLARSLTVVDLQRDAEVPPGAALSAVALQPESRLGARVQPALVERIEIARKGLHDRYGALGRIPTLARSLPAAFRGAPLMGVDGRVYGLALIEGEVAALLPGPLVHTLLEDTLRHPNETAVTVFRGLRGRWELPPSADLPLAFLVTDVGRDGPFPESGLRRGDRILRVNDQPLAGPLPLLLPLLEAVRNQRPVTVEVLRDAATLRLDIRPAFSEPSP